MSITTTSVEATRAFGRALAAHLRPGDVIVLTGDLGAGKTACSQGIAAGLGVTDRVTSPTFTIVQEYEGDIPVQHLDLYRLGSVQEVLDLGLDETIDDRVTLVEWGDVALAALPEEHLELVITLMPDAGDDVRTITANRRGSRWAALDVDALAAGSA